MSVISLINLKGGVGKTVGHYYTAEVAADSMI